MAAEPRLRRDHIDQITFDFLRLQRTQPDPQGETLLLDQLQQFMEIRPALEIGSVLPQVNPSQYDLFVSLVGKRPEHGDRRLRMEAPEMSPRKGDNAVAAKGITPILNLEETSRAAREHFSRKRGGLETV